MFFPTVKKPSRVGSSGSDEKSVYPNFSKLVTYQQSDYDSRELTSSKQEDNKDLKRENREIRESIRITAKNN